MAAVQDIAFVRYQATDLDRMEDFLADFGLRRSARAGRALYMRTLGRAHHQHVTELGETDRVLGFGLLATGAEALRELAQRTGRPVEQVDEPGGGQRVRLTDPSGFLIDVLHGQEELAALSHRASLGMNMAGNRARVGTTVRVGPAPSNVLRLGHVALLVSDFQASLAFYRDVLGMKPSDVYYAGHESNEVAAFLHCGLGQTWTDHHTVAVIQAPDGQARMDHSAFEVLDLDDVMQGGEYLKQRGRKRSWGVGRHIQGSQIFDYWRDPFGNKVEHWTDGDLVNDESPVGRAHVGENELSQWAPPLTPEFFA